MIKIQTNKKLLIETLKELRDQIQDIEGSSIVMNNGLVIASDLMQDTDSQTFAAMAAEMTKSARIVTSELKIGKLNETIISSSSGNIAFLEIGKEAILICLLKRKSNLGLTLLHMKRAITKLSRLI